MNSTEDDRNELERTLTVEDGRATLKWGVYSPYFALRPHEVMARAEEDFDYQLEKEGLTRGPATFTQLDDPLKRDEHAFDRLWITGPWFHRYVISADVWSAGDER